MKCHVCGSKMKSMVIDIPFKVNQSTIIIFNAFDAVIVDSDAEDIPCKRSQGVLSFSHTLTIDDPFLIWL